MYYTIECIINVVYNLSMAVLRVVSVTGSTGVLALHRWDKCECRSGKIESLG